MHRLHVAAARVEFGQGKVRHAAALALEDQLVGNPGNARNDHQHKKDQCKIHDGLALIF
ncbi:hypothetical protein D3C81_2177600 [compost metagenome]